MTIPPDTTIGAIPLQHAALCVTCEAIIDLRVLTDTTKRTCRDHTWVRITRWLPHLDAASERVPAMCPNCDQTKERGHAPDCPSPDYVIPY